MRRHPHPHRASHLPIAPSLCRWAPPAAQHGPQLSHVSAEAQLTEAREAGLWQDAMPPAWGCHIQAVLQEGLQHTSYGRPSGTVYSLTAPQVPASAQCAACARCVSPCGLHTSAGAGPGAGALLGSTFSLPARGRQLILLCYILGPAGRLPAQSLQRRAIHRREAHGFEAVSDVASARVRFV